MAFFLAILSFLLGLGVKTDSDGDGVPAFRDCDDTDPGAWVAWCHDGDGDGASDCVTLIAPQCLGPEEAPVDASFLRCDCPAFGGWSP